MRKPRPSLLAQLVLALAVVGLVPLAFAGWRLVGLNREALREQVLRSNAVAAGAAAARIGELVAARRDLAAAAAVVAGAPDPGEALAGWLAGRDDVAAAALSVPEGEVVRVRRRDLDPAVEALLPAAGAPPVTLAGASGGRWLLLAVPVPGVEGLLAAVLDAAALDEALDPVALGEQASLTLVDRDGVWLAGSPPDPDGLPPAALAGWRTGRLTGAGVFPTASGDEVLAAFDAVPGTSWTVVSRQPAAVAEATAAAMTRGAGVAVALALVLTAALAAGGFVTVVRPIRRLAALQRRLAGLAGPPPGGEMAALEASYAELERRVRHREALERVFLGRYQVLDVLGRGAMGIVFRGWDPKLQRPVALKTLRLDAEAGSPGGDAIRRLLQEAVTAARFSHPHIVGVFDVGESDEAAFIAMELVEGESLERRLWAVHALDPPSTARLGAAIAGALASAHGRGVVHKDVKPANVLLGRDGEVKVTDFGISQLVSRLAERDDAVFGTPGFVPPEALRGGPFDERGDLFSLGAVLYQCATGVRPFGGGSLREVIRRTLDGEVVPPRELNRAIPEALSALVCELLSTDPARRGSAAEAAERLEALAGGSLAAHPAASPATGRAPARRPDTESPRATRVEVRDATDDEPEETLPTRFIPLERLGGGGAGGRPSGGG